MEITPELESQHLSAQDQLAQMTNYHAWSLSYLGQDLGKVVWDAGAGAGLLGEKILESDPEVLILTEYTEGNLDILRRKFGSNERVIVQYFDLLNPGKLMEGVQHPDTILLLDVLEHLAVDSRGLKTLFDRLQPGGHLLIKVPAHPFLFCEIDRASLHYRRYTVKSLHRRLTDAGFSVSRIKYMNMPGAILYFLKGKVLKKRDNFSRTVSSDKLKLMNRAIPFISTLEKIIPALFGLSVIAVAKKPG